MPPLIFSPNSRLNFIVYISLFYIICYFPSTYTYFLHLFFNGTYMNYSRYLSYKLGNINIFHKNLTAIEKQIANICFSMAVFYYYTKRNNHDSMFWLIIFAKSQCNHIYVNIHKNYILLCTISRAKKCIICKRK